MIFIDLRDRSGIVQVTFDVKDKEIHTVAEKLRSEYVIAVTGKVIARAKEAINPKMPTGEIEIEANKLEILNSYFEILVNDLKTFC